MGPSAFPAFVKMIFLCRSYLVGPPSLFVPELSHCFPPSELFPLLFLALLLSWKTFQGANFARGELWKFRVKAWVRSHKKRCLDKSDLPAWKRGCKWLFPFISVLLLAKLFSPGPWSRCHSDLCVCRETFGNQRGPSAASAHLEMITEPGRWRAHWGRLERELQALN